MFRCRKRVEAAAAFPNCVTITRSRSRARAWRAEQREYIIYMDTLDDEDCRARMMIESTMGSCVTRRTGKKEERDRRPDVSPPPTYVAVLRCVWKDCDVVCVSLTSRPPRETSSARSEARRLLARGFTASSGRAARTGGNLCRARIVFARAEGSRLYDTSVWRDTRLVVVLARWFFQRLPPRLSLPRETLRSPDADNPVSHCAVAPVTGGGGPRVLGRAARLIEGPIPGSLRARAATLFSSRETARERARAREGRARCIVKRISYVAF